MYEEIAFLSELSYATGLIGLAELKERGEVARWLTNTDNRLRDPRQRCDEPREHQEAREPETSDAASPVEGVRKDDSTDQWTHLVVLNKWVFTIGDADCYPSVPHGHFQRKTNPWPKLNPYTGRVFVAPHEEDKLRRLTRIDMQMLWNDEQFLSFCRSQIEWYSRFAPQFQFANAKSGRYHFPRWRLP